MRIGERYTLVETHPQRPAGVYRCPCCRFRTLAERGGSEMCPICSWEDDGQDDANADYVRGGPNGSLLLTQARENFRTLGGDRAPWDDER